MNVTAQLEAREPAVRRWRAVPWILTGLVLVLQIGAILQRNHGTLTYTLDDAYVHLAVSESLSQGHYGIELSEPSAPSSSILWPFLLAPGALLTGHGLWPLLLNLLSVAVTIGLLVKALRLCGLTEVAGGEAFSAGLVTILVLMLNLTGLVLTGMEHSLQVALALLVILGMIEIDRGGVPPWTLTVAIVLGPLVRYESLALSAAALFLLGARGHRRLAVVAGLCCMLPVVVFSLFLVRLGLDPLPGPVMESFGDGGSAASGSLLGWLWERVETIFVVLRARMLALFVGALLATALFSVRRDKSLLLCGAGAAGLHLVFGSCRGFARYEIYILVSVLVLLLYGLRKPLRSLLEAQRPTVCLLAAGLVLLPSLAGYAAVSYRSPQAAHNIYQQQVQMHRFVAEHYRKPLAVNDLGRVAFENPHQVLDLWGLSSGDVRRARLRNDRRWPGAFVEEQGIELAMIYDSWFVGRVPVGWQRVARLELLGKRITPSSSTVSFYVTRPEAVAEVAASLRAFAPTLPTESRLVLEQPMLGL